MWLVSWEVLQGQRAYIGKMDDLARSPAGGYTFCGLAEWTGERILQKESAGGQASRKRQVDWHLTRQFSVVELSVGCITVSRRRRIRRGSAAMTWMPTRPCSHFSPFTGTLPRALNTKPPIVS